MQDANDAAYSIGIDGGFRTSCESARAGRNDMLKWAIFFAIVALVAGLFGFTGVAAGAAGIAKILFIVFLVLFVAVLLFALLGAKAISNR
jgi:uncharacterized membrane protein YtjA (UPF0391 family)